jgi:parvulin-like peptidyl-prolyl isomerase
MRDLARVNGQVITLREIRHSMGPSYDQYLDRLEDLARFVRAKVLERLLRRIVVEEARRVGFTVTDEELEQETQRQEKRAAEAGTTLERTILDQGMTRREWDDDLRDDILFYRARAYFTGQFPDRFYDLDRYRPSVDPFVRPEEIRRFGEGHAEELGVRTAARATVRVIDLRFDSFRGPGASEEEARRACARAMDAVEERLRAGEPFADLAREVSRGPEAAGGGLVGPFEGDGPLRREYREWAFREGRSDGDLSPRLALPTGLVILRMERLEPERVRPIEEWAPEARARLLDVKRTLAWNDVQAALLEEASVQPADLKAALLAQLRGNGRRLREELP